MGEKGYEIMSLSNSEKKEIYKHVARECTAFLKERYNVGRVYIIGSLVRGVFHDRSDIDLVVEGLAPELYIKVLTELYDLLPAGTELNLIPFEDAHESLKERTINEGQLVYD